MKAKMMTRGDVRKARRHVSVALGIVKRAARRHARRRDRAAVTSGDYYALTYGLDAYDVS